MVGKAKTFEGDSANIVSLQRNKLANYATGRDNPDLIGATQFNNSESSGISSIGGINSDKTKLPLEGGLIRGNMGFEIATIRLVVGTNVLQLDEDDSGVKIPRIHDTNIVTLDTGTSGTLTTIKGAMRDGQRLRLLGVAGNTVTVTHTAAATNDTITCPDDVNATLTGDEVMDLVYEAISTTLGKWRVIGAAAAVSNVPDGTAEFQHLEWDGAAWQEQIALSFGATAADSGFLKFPNNFVALAWRNFANNGNVRIFVDTNDELIFDQADQVEIHNTLTGAQGIGNFNLFRDDAAPSTGDELGSFRMDGRDSGGDRIQYARILGGIADVTDVTGEAGLLQFEVAEQGSLIPYIRLNDSNLGRVHFLRNISTGSTFSDSGFVRMPNNFILAGWRNLADNANVRIFVDTNDDFIFDGADQFKLQSFRTGASGSANFVSFRDDASPTTGDELGSLRFDGKDSGGDTIQYASLLAGIANVTDVTGENGLLFINVAESGSLVSYIELNFPFDTFNIGIKKDMDINQNGLIFDGTTAALTTTPPASLSMQYRQTVSL